MQYNKRKRIFLLLGLTVFCFIIVYGVFLNKNIITINNKALVVESKPNLSKGYLIDEINKSNKKSLALVKKINQKWRLFTSKDTYKKQLTDLLTQRKSLIIQALNNSVDIQSIQSLDFVVGEIVNNSKLIEKRVSIKNAQITTLYVDNFDPQNHETTYKYMVIDNSSSTIYNLVLLNDIKYQSGVIDIMGMVFGNDLYSTIEVEKINRTTPDDTETVSAHSHKTLVLLVNTPASSENTPFTSSQAHNLIFNGQFKDFMMEQSYGKADFTGDVYGWITLPSIFDFNWITYSSTNNIDLGQYDHMVIINDSPDFANATPFPLTASSSIGKTVSSSNFNLSMVIIGFWGSDILLDDSYFTNHFTNGGTDLPFSWTNLDELFSHELGHSMGLWHSEGWDCGIQQAGSSCQNAWYGNTLDIMGNGNFAFHYNGWQKRNLGWIHPKEVLTITKSGIYNLSPLEPQTVKGKRVAFIKPSGTDYPTHVVEYRQAMGFDQHLNQSINKNGFYINRININGACVSGVPSTDLSLEAECKSYLVDSQPTDLSWYLDTEVSSLNANNNPIFNDPEYQIQIKNIVSSSNNLFDFEVCINNIDCLE